MHVAISIDNISQLLHLAASVSPFLSLSSHYYLSILILRAVLSILICRNYLNFNLVFLKFIVVKIQRLVLRLDG